MAALPSNIGWIGLGIMGLPMVRNLLRQMNNSTQFYVYDVIQESIDKFVEDGKGRVHACSSSKEVADKSVWLRTGKISKTSWTIQLIHLANRTSSFLWCPKAAT